MESFLISAIHNFPFQEQHVDRSADQQSFSQSDGVIGVNL